MNEQHVITLLKKGGVGVLPTDTLYGLVGSALLPDAVLRIYELKRRNETKPLIVLIAEVSDIEQFGVVLSEQLENRLAKYWPGAYSIRLPIIDDQFEYLSRGMDTIAFRLPDTEELREFLRETGPLVAPSANIENLPPATTIAEAKRYFGTDVDFYIDGGELRGKASTVIEFDDEEVIIHRE